MRVKNIPQRLIQEVNKVMIKCTKNEWRSSIELDKCEDNYISKNVWRDYESQMCGALDLSIKNSSSSSSLFALDLSMKAEKNKNPSALMTVNYTTKMQSTSESAGELKDLFLYKMLTDPGFIDNIKRAKYSKLISCQYCKKNFLSHLDLYNHQNEVMDVINSQVSCCACDKIFSQQRYLGSHRRCHLEKNKFTCNICTRRYSRQDNLARHNTFHTNPNKFPCSFCERTFTRKDLLNKHIKRHENKYRYHCNVCHKYFRGPLLLANHNQRYHSTVN
ncbi:hypothetical protein PV327_010691 [Microctonus hyperodae]|uniref:C2H2-type domain-containing protein n=1 Tax=Microctonus hyperodae TaxID=165561 RepID=A0AA39C800_MICHY|nr:hypothetical protein PV327_010691 [Microctonus hyperodae]